MTQFTCKGVKQINNRISFTFKHLYHLYLSAFFISAGVPNGEFPEILIAKCRSWFYCTWYFCWGEIVREINVSRAWDPVHARDKALMRETHTKRGRVNRYAVDLPTCTAVLVVPAPAKQNPHYLIFKSCKSLGWLK